MLHVGSNGLTRNLIVGKRGSDVVVVVVVGVGVTIVTKRTHELLLVLSESFGSRPIHYTLITLEKAPS